MRRTALLVILIALIVGTLPGTALAWCNGPAKNHIAGNGYGSHDWILEGAIKHAGSAGTWVWDTTALYASDDPDTQKVPPVYHWFQETGRVRGAPYMVSELYHKAVVAYRAGDRRSASKYVGLLSHYYADITEPFHTSGRASSYKALHIQYEYAVDDYQNTSTRSRSWVTLRSIVPVADIRTKTISAALYARSQFPSLLSSYNNSRSVRAGTPNKITRRVMSRAVNGLADIIATIPTGAGETTFPDTVDFKISDTSVRQNTKVGASVRCTDANGDPMDAVRVQFVWRLASGTVTRTTYTGATGFVSHWLDIGSAPTGRKAYVTATVIANGDSEASELSFTPWR